MFGCKLSSLRRKSLVTNSRALSAKLLETVTHFGVEPHTVKSLAHALFGHPAFSASGGLELRRLSPEGLEFLGQEIREALPKKNYFKQAFELPGLRAKVFDCLEELRLSGYTPDILESCEIENREKLLALSEVFSLYVAGLERRKVFDYPMVVRILLDRVQKGDYDAYLKDTDIIIPFELDLYGPESDLLEELSSKATNYGPKGTEREYIADTDPKSLALVQFKKSLKKYLDREPLESTTRWEKIDPSVTLRSSLTPIDTVSGIFEWMSSLNARIDNTSIVSVNYDAHAGDLYRFCVMNNIPLNLVHGLLAEEFAFFAEDMITLEEIWERMRFKDYGNYLTEARSYMVQRKSEMDSYESFRKQVLYFIDEYLRAKGDANVKELKAWHGFDSLRSYLLEIRLPANSLGLERYGLFFGKPENLLGIKTEYLAVIGLQDHHYPPKVVPDPVLTDEERSDLNELIPKVKGIFELRLSALKEIEKDLLEKICLGVRKGVCLGFESHDLSSGALALPSAFLSRYLGAFGEEIKVDCLYKRANVSDSFLPPSPSPFLSYDKYLATRGETTPRVSAWYKAIKRQKAGELNEEDGARYAEGPMLLKETHHATSITDFFSCPYRFYLSKIQRIEEPEIAPEDTLRWLDHLQYGSFVHGVYERIVTAFLNGKGELKSWIMFLDEKAPALLDAVIEEVQKEDDFVESRKGVPEVIIENEVSNIHEIAEEFIAREKILAEEEGFYPLFAEKKFAGINYEVEIDGKTVSLTFGGTVDRMDTDGNGRYRIIDYKTGKCRFKNKENLFLDNGKYTHFQHVIYGLWAVKGSGLQVEEKKMDAGYYFATPNGEWGRVIAPFTDFKKQFKNTMTVFAEALLRGEFSKNAGSCRNCPYQLVCSGVQKRRSSFVGASEQIEKVKKSLDRVEEENDE